MGYYLYLDYMGDYWFETGHAEYWQDRKAKEAVWLGDWKCDKSESVYPYCVESRHKAMKAHPDYEELHTRSAYANGYRMDASNWSTVAAAALAMLFIPPVMIVVVAFMRRDGTHD